MSFIRHLRGVADWEGRGDGAATAAPMEFAENSAAILFDFFSMLSDHATTHDGNS